MLQRKDEERETRDKSSWGEKERGMLCMEMQPDERGHPAAEKSRIVDRQSTHENPVGSQHGGGILLESMTEREREREKEGGRERESWTEPACSGMDS